MASIYILVISVMVTSLPTGQEPLHLVESAPTVAGGEEASSAAVELCMQCQANDPHYHELDGSDEDSLSSPPPVPHRGGSPEPGVLLML